MLSDRSSQDATWQEIRTFLAPIMQSIVSREPKGTRGRHEQLDNSGETASEVFASGLHGFLSNPGTKWFAVRAKDRSFNQDFEVARWTEQVTDHISQVFESAESKFAIAIGEAYSSLGDFGTATVSAMDRRGKLPIFRKHAVGEIATEENHEGDLVDTFRRWKMSARMAQREFGPAAGQRVSQSAAGSRADDEFEFLHAVVPRAGGLKGGRHPLRMPFASVTINVTEKHLIRESGFQENPFINGRWRKRDGEDAGRGPGEKALGDVKMLQRVMKATIRGAEKSINPSLLVADDGVIGQINQGQNGITYVRSDLFAGRQSPVQAMNHGARPDFGEEFMASIRSRIEAAYFVPLFRMSRDPRMSATQSLIIDEETLRVLGPFLGRVNVELLGPLIDRAIGIELRAGRLPPAPAILEGRETEIEFVSPLAKAQRLSEVAAGSRLYEANQGLIALDPAILDNWDTDEKFRNDADRLGVPKTQIRPVETVAKMRAARQEAQRRQAEIEQGATIASAAQSAGQAAGALQNAGLLPGANDNGGGAGGQAAA